MLTKTYSLLHKLKSNLFFIIYRRRFKNVGKKSRMYSPLKVEGMEHISIGQNVMINNGVWLAALPLTGSNVELTIADGVSIGHFNHIYATSSITIEKDVLTADKVYISDNLHHYEDVEVPVIKQPVKQCNSVVIGEGAWLGENVCIIGASVGKHSVVGANSVVTHSIPDFCVAVGCPARIIKKYDFTKHAWVIVNEK